MLSSNLFINSLFDIEEEKFDFVNIVGWQALIFLLFVLKHTIRNLRVTSLERNNKINHR